MRKSKREKEKCGVYTVQKHPKGGFTITGGSLRPDGFYVPSDERLRNRNGVSELTWKTYVGWRGVLNGGKRSISAGLEALGMSHRNVTRKEIVESIKKFWPENMIRKHYDGESPNEDMPSLERFAEKHLREYHSASRTFGGFRKMVEEAYPQNEYPNLYYDVSRRRDLNKINTKDLGKRLFAIFCEGRRGIGRTALSKSPVKKERKLAREVIALAKGNWIKGARTYQEVVINLTGLKATDITLSPYSQGDCVMLTENLTRSLIVWSFITGMNLRPYLAPGKVYTAQEYREFFYKTNLGRADARVDNTAIETKTGLYISTKQALDDMLAKYAPINAPCWRKGRLPFEKSVVVMHAEPSESSATKKELEKAGILVIDYPLFNDYLKELTAKMKESPYAAQIAKMQPRIHNLSTLVKLHEEVSLKPYILMRESNIDRRLWSIKVLKSLNTLGEEVYEREYDHQRGL